MFDFYPIRFLEGEIAALVIEIVRTENEVQMSHSYSFIN